LINRAPAVVIVILDVLSYDSTIPFTGSRFELGFLFWLLYCFMSLIEI
jgi:hypothetical protein